MTGGGGVPGETLVQRRSEALREGEPHPRFMALTCLGGENRWGSGRGGTMAGVLVGAVTTHSV